MTKDNKRKLQFNKIKKICKYILVIEVFALFVAASYAWYSYPSTRGLQSASAEVEKVVTLSLLDDTATRSLQLFVGNLYPGQKNRLVVCISNNPMDNTNRRVGDIDYELKLAHTNNLPVYYHLYPLTTVNKEEEYDIHIEHPEENLQDTYFAMKEDANGQKTPYSYDIAIPEPTEGQSQPSDPNAWINEPEYQIYNHEFKLAMTEENYDYNYYLLEIEMPKELPDNILFNDIKKEVDMVYIIATIKQSQ